MSLMDQISATCSPKANYKKLLHGLLDYISRDSYCPEPVTFESVDDCKELSFVQDKDRIRILVNSQIANYIFKAIDNCLCREETACIAWIAKDGNTYQFEINATQVSGCDFYEFLGHSHNDVCTTSAVAKITVYCSCWEEPEQPPVDPVSKQWIDTNCVFLPNPELTGNNALIYDRVCGDPVWICTTEPGQPYWFNPQTCLYERVDKNMANLGKPTQINNKSCEEVKLNFECVNDTDQPITQTHADIVAKAIAGANQNGLTWPNGDPITADAADFQFEHRIYACVVGNGTPVQLDDGSTFIVSCDGAAATLYPNSGSNGTSFSKGAWFELGGGPDAIGDQIGETDSVTIAPGAAISGQVWVGRCRDKNGNLIDCSTPRIPSNLPPTIIPGEELPDQTNVQGSPITPVPTSQKFTDSDGTIVSYSAAGLPAGLSINPTTGAITGTPTAAPGNYNVIVTAVDDDGATVPCPFVWTITDTPNNPPTIIPGEDLPDQTNVQNSPITPVNTSQKFTDSDGTIVSYSAAVLPAGLTINTTTGAISGTPTAAPGDYNVTVTAVDDDGASVDCPFVWTITPVIEIVATDDTVTDPVQPGQPGPSVFDNDTVDGNGSTDVNTTTPTVVNDGGMTGVSFNPDGTINIPAGTTDGDYTITYEICAEDDPAVCDQAQITLTVVQPTEICYEDCSFVAGPNAATYIRRSGTGVANPDNAGDAAAPGGPFFNQPDADGIPSIEPTQAWSTLNLGAGSSEGHFNDPSNGTTNDWHESTAYLAIPSSACLGGASEILISAHNFGDAHQSVWAAGGWDRSALQEIGRYSEDSFAQSGSLPIMPTDDTGAANPFWTGDASMDGTITLPLGAGITPAVIHANSVDERQQSDVWWRYSLDGGTTWIEIPQDWFYADPADAAQATADSVIWTCDLNGDCTSSDGGTDTEANVVANGGVQVQCPSNQAPTIIPGEELPDQSNEQGTPITPVATSQKFTDSDGTIVSYSASGLPAGLTINATTGAITGTPAAAPGNYNVVVTATDDDGATVDCPFVWTISEPPNNPPTIIPGQELPDQTDEMDTPITPVATAQKFTDSDGTIVGYGATGLPAGLSIDTATGVISGTPTAAPGSYNVVVTATDDDGATVDCPFVWTVTEPPNNPPTILPGQDLPDQTDTEGQPITPVETSQKFTDSDGTIVGYTATGLPASLTINPTTGQISGAPDVGAAANSPYSVVVTATDDDGATVDCPFEWTVEPDVLTKQGVPLGFGLDGASGNLGPNNESPDPSYITGLPNDQVWVNFDDGETVEFMFQNAFSSTDPANQSLVFEAGFNPTEYSVELLMCDGTYKDPVTVVNNNSEPSKEWTYDWYSETIGGGTTQTSSWCVAPTLADLGVGANEIVQGIRITVNSAVAVGGGAPPANQGDLAGVYVDSGVTTEDITSCVPPAQGPIKAAQPDRLFAKWEDPSVSIDVSQLFTGADSYSASGLPAGLSLSGSNIVGSPTTQGTGTLTITATNADGSTDCEIPYEIGSCPPESIYEEDFNQYHTGGGDSNTIPTAPGSGRGHWTEAPGAVRYLNYGGSPGLLNTIWYSFSGFNGSNNGFLRIEPIPVTPGEEYKLCYRAARDNGPGGQRVEYRQNGGAWQTLIPNYDPAPHNPGGSSVNHRGWGVYEGVFTATGTDVEFRFVALQNTTNGNDEGVNDICLFPTAGVLS